MQISHNVAANDCAFSKWDDDIPCFTERAWVGIHNHARALYGFGIHFTIRGSKCTNQIEMDAGPQPSAIEKRQRCRGTGADHIRFCRTSPGVGRPDRDTQLRAHFVSEGLAALWSRSADQNSFKLQ